MKSSLERYFHDIYHPKRILCWIHINIYRMTLNSVFNLHSKITFVFIKMLSENRFIIWIPFIATHLTSLCGRIDRIQTFFSFHSFSLSLHYKIPNSNYNLWIIGINIGMFLSVWMWTIEKIKPFYSLFNVHSLHMCMNEIHRKFT